MKKFILFLILLFPACIKAIDISATSAILMDMDSGRILYGKNINNIRSVASISKIMTGILAVESDKLDEEVIIGDEIDGSYGSGIYIKKGEKMTIRDLTYGLMLRSGNDASLAIAHHTSGSIDKFVKLMNQKAKQLNMRNTTFNNPNGLDEDKGNYSTAYDMALLTSYAMKNEDYREIVKTKKYTLKTNLNVYSWTNKNKLLRTYKYTTGGKTGFTVKARRTLVTTASLNNLNLVVVTLNDGNDFKDHMDLFDYAFDNYKSYEILKKGSINIPGEKYYKGYSFYIKNEYRYPLSKEEKDNIIIKYELEKIRNIKNNIKVGIVKVYLGDEQLYSEDIYIKKKEAKKNFWISIKEWMNSLW